MKIIVPLSGPDFVIGESTKAEIDLNGTPFLKSVLDSRPWHKAVTGNDYIFVLLDNAVTRKYLAKNCAFGTQDALLFFFRMFLAEQRFRQ